MIKEVFSVLESMDRDADGTVLNWDEVRTFSAECNDDSQLEKAKEYAVKHARSTGNAVRIDWNQLHISRLGKECLDSDPDLFGYDPEVE